MERINFGHRLSTDTTGINGIKSTGTTDTSDVTSKQYENDQLFEQLPDLVNNQFRAWFCGHFYRLGKVKVLQLASIARADGNQPSKYFCKLLKEAR